MKWLPMALLLAGCPKANDPESGMNPRALRVALIAEGTEIRATVTNPTDAPVTFCNYQSPFEPIMAPIFEIEGVDGTLDYQGPMVKRMPPDAGDYRTVKPGQSLTSKPIDLQSVYALEPGSYRIRYIHRSMSGLPTSDWLQVDYSASELAAPRCARCETE